MPARVVYASAARSAWGAVWAVLRSFAGIRVGVEQIARESGVSPHVVKALLDAAVAAHLVDVTPAVGLLDTHRWRVIEPVSPLSPLAIPHAAPDFGKRAGQPYPSAGRQIGPAWQALWTLMRASHPFPVMMRPLVDEATRVLESQRVECADSTLGTLLYGARRAGLLETPATTTKQQNSWRILATRAVVEPDA